MAAFWTDETDDDLVVDTVADAIQPVAVKGHGGVSLLTDPPDIPLRRILRSIPGLEGAAETPALPSLRPSPAEGQEQEA